MPLYRITPHSDDIVAVLNSTTQELADFRKKATNNETRLTDQDLTSVIECLQRREHYLENLFGKRLTQDEHYRMPEEWIDAIKGQIDFFQKDTSVRARVEAIAGQQGVFYALLSKINEFIEKPTEVIVRPNVIKLDVSKTESSEDEGPG